MTDEQIIKVLRCSREAANDYGNAEVCDFLDNVIDLINRRKAENEKLDRQYQAAKKKILSLCGRLHNASTENAELKQKNRKYINRIEKDIVLPTIFGEQARTEAIKEFAKFLIEKSKDGKIFISDIPDYVKEMTEV